MLTVKEPTPLMENLAVYILPEHIWKDIDGKAAQAWQAAKSDAYYFDNCKAEQTYAEEAMAKAGKPDELGRLLEGKVS